MNIGLFFGSFNPIHVGHLIIANHVLNFSKLQKIWFVVSPHNPLKEKRNLLNQYDRLHLLNLAIQNNNKFKGSDIEFKLKQPSYTIDTLEYLKEKYPNHDFSLIMGSDNISSINKWKNYEMILNHYKIIIYQRAGTTESKYHSHKNVIIIDNVPILDLSATQIRTLIKENKSIRYLVPDSVYEYINTNKYYTK